MSEVVLLLGLENPLDRELQRAIQNAHRTVHAYPCLSPEASRDLIERLCPSLVFLGGDWRSTRDLLRNASVPVIVVSRQPEISDWLDAIEAGATDYCAPPFESAHISWILESAEKARAIAA